MLIRSCSLLSCSRRVGCRLLICDAGREGNGKEEKRKEKCKRSITNNSRRPAAGGMPYHMSYGRPDYVHRKHFGAITKGAHTHTHSLTHSLSHAHCVDL